MMQLGVRGKVSAALAAGFVAGIAVSFWLGAWPYYVWRQEQEPRSPLTENLDRDWKTASAQFDARIKRRFPPGTRIATLAEGLETEGFSPTWFKENSGYGARRIESSYVCNKTFSIYWRAGENGVISEIGGDYRFGCL